LIALSKAGEGVAVNTVSNQSIESFENAGIEWGAFFGDVAWLERLRDRLVPASSLFSIARGERRGWNAMFYPGGNHGIEKRYLRPVLRSPSTVQGLVAEPDGVAFCCTASLRELSSRGDKGALRWIRRFSRETNTKGDPLPEVLAQGGDPWYGMSDSTVADVVGLVNPGSRLFFPRMRERGFVDQRLVRFTVCEDTDLDLAHALLNSLLSLYYLEAIGFGRGLGALDLNATKMKERLKIFDPEHLDAARRSAVVDAFTPLLERDVFPIPTELEQADRRNFDRVVFAAYGVERLLPSAREALLTMYRIRMAAVE